MELLALLALVPILGYAYLTWRYGYWKRRGVPYDKPKLLGGAFKDVILFRKTIGEVYQDIYRRMEEHPFCGYFKCFKPALLIRDPELIRTILVKDFNSFRDNDFHQDPAVDPMFGRSPFSVKGDSWKTVRSQLSPTFTASRVRAIFPQMAVVCRELTEFLERETSPNPEGVVDVKRMAAMFTTDSVALCMLGVHGNALRDPAGEFGRIGSFLLEESLPGTIQVISIMLIPKIAHWLRFRFIPEVVAQFFRQVIREATEYREKSGQTVADYLQISIALRNKPQGFSDEDAAAHAAMFYLDGVEPTSTIMALALYELAINPSVQTKLRMKVDKVLEEHNGELGSESLHDMTYLNMVVTETLRKYPPLRSLDRLCTRPYDLQTKDGKVCRIEPDTPVIIPVYAIHRDPEHYPEPEKFKPERFTEDNIQTRSKYTYLPFGEGPRACLGSKYAITAIMMGLASIVRQYNILPLQQTPTAISHDKYSPFYLAARESLCLKFQRRVDATSSTERSAM